MSNVQIAIQRALVANPLREPLLHTLIQSLQLPPGSRGLDAGCGMGLQAVLLAEAVGPEGHITGIDLAPELLAFAAGHARAAAVAQRISFCTADASKLPLAADSFDWLWSADCIGYPLAELAPMLAELIRVVRPGGEIFLLGWSSQQLLPGYPFLEARLNATCSAYLPYIDGKSPELNFLRALSGMRAAGLEDVRAETFVHDVQGPVSDRERLALASLFDMLWGERRPAVTDADWDEFQRLCRPTSPDFIVDCPAYYAFFTYSLFRGRLPAP